MVTILQGDALEKLRELPDESVQCCVTSPPYWGLRDYGVNSQVGLEKTPEEYVRSIVAVMHEVRRILRGDGTCWLNLGDSYYNYRPGGDGLNRSGLQKNTLSLPEGTHRRATKFEGLKEKDIVGIPWMLAFALRADGWYLRQDIIWAKPNPMPESVRDRCTKSHEYIFLLSKSPHYFYDYEAIQEASIYGDPRKPYCPGQVDSRGTGHDRDGGEIRPACRKHEGVNSRFHQDRDPNHPSERKVRASVKRGDFNGKTNALPGREAFRAIEHYRNKRSVWTVATSPYREAHFATFPPDLIKPCILAGTQPAEFCAEHDFESGFCVGPCSNRGSRSVVLDPFAGSGTTGMVALELGRKAILIELNPDYINLIKARTNVTYGLPLGSPPATAQNNNLPVPALAEPNASRDDNRPATDTEPSASGDSRGGQNISQLPI
jgi:DNA modification methylase